MSERLTVTERVEKPELWGLEDLAEALGISATLAYKWRERGKLPEPDYVVSGRPIWLADRARRWIEERRTSAAER